MTNANKLGRLVTYNEELSSIKLKDPLTRGLARSHDKSNMFYLLYHKAYW